MRGKPTLPRLIVGRKPVSTRMERGGKGILHAALILWELRQGFVQVSMRDKIQADYLESQKMPS